MPLLFASAAFIDILQLGLSLGTGIIPGGGVVLGFILSICISSTLGSAHVFAAYVVLSEQMSNLRMNPQSRLLVGAGSQILQQMLLFSLLEFVPGINNLPIWVVATTITWRKMRRVKAKEESLHGKEPAEPSNSIPTQGGGVEQESFYFSASNDNEEEGAPPQTKPSRPQIRPVGSPQNAKIAA